MLVPRAVLLRCKDTPLRNPQLDEMPVIVPPTTSKKAGKPTFLFGNYKSYYGYRTEEDPRMKHLKKEWFYGKRCLDIGCNTGAISFEIGRLFGYRSMMGVDIDGSLIRKAESMRMSILEKNPDKADDKFPHNLSFKTENFIDATHDEFFDTILSFSITKWIHLNWGDEGIRRFFRNINACLRPGGFLLLEPQEFSSYKRRSHLTPQFRANYKAIVLKPRHFADFLAAEYGFEHLRSEEIEHTSKGFARPILVFRKPVAEFVKQGDWVPPATEPAGQADAEADGEAEVFSSVAATEADSESIEHHRRRKDKKQRKKSKEGAEAPEGVQEGSAAGGVIEVEEVAAETKKAKKHKRRAHDEEASAVGGEEEAPEDTAHKKRAKRKSREHGGAVSHAEAVDGGGQGAEPESAPAAKKEKRHKHKSTREKE